MAEPAPAAPAPEAATPAPAAEPAKQPTQQERMQAAIEAGKKATASKGDVAEAEEPKAEESAKAEGDDAPAAGETEKPKTEAGAEEPTPEVKTARAKEWVKINKTKEELARERREVKRDREAAIAERAELQKIQHEYAELGRLFRDSPKQFVERLSGRPGGLRELFIAATEEEKRTPEEEEKIALKKEVEALKNKLTKWETEAEQIGKAREAEERRQATIKYHQDNLANCRAGVETLVSGGGFPSVAAQYPTKRSREQFAEKVYEAIYAHFERTKVERPISDVLDDVEAELAKEAGSAPAAPTPPAQATGAEPTAKPEAKPKRTPPTMTNAQASARASAGRELKGDERKRYFASLLRTRPD